MMTASGRLGRSRPGITLVEILISILILGIGLVSLATLFPIGLLRLREAARSSRSAYLLESAAADMAGRGLLNVQGFQGADLLNWKFGLPVWYPQNQAALPYLPNGYDPLIQDAGIYGPYLAYVPANPLATQGVTSPSSGGYGLPFAYDPLWRYQFTPVGGGTVAAGTNGCYLFDPNSNYPNNPYINGHVVPEGRFAAGVDSTTGSSLLRADPNTATDGLPASAHGLQRLTNFNRPLAMPSARMVPNIFVSPEDVVWNETNNPANLSPVLPDLTLGAGAPIQDWRYSWMFTGKQTNSANASAFEGNIVILENRPFGLDPVTSPIGGGTFYKPSDETVVEAIWGYGQNVVAFNGGSVGFAAGADRTVLLRWPNSVPDPLVKVGDWIADVTYERHGIAVATRFAGVANVFNQGELDNLPAQRCFWYQVAKVAPAADAATADLIFSTDTVSYRYMIVYVSTALQARTPLMQNTKNGSTFEPYTVNAALICPTVVNVIPQTFFVR